MQPDYLIINYVKGCEGKAPVKLIQRQVISRSDIHIIYKAFIGKCKSNYQHTCDFYWQCIFVNNVILFYKRKTLIPQVTACVSKSQFT